MDAFGAGVPVPAGAFLESVGVPVSGASVVFLQDGVRDRPGLHILPSSPACARACDLLNAACARSHRAVGMCLLAVGCAVP
jgi:hypothetical protein